MQGVFLHNSTQKVNFYEEKDCIVGIPAWPTSVKHCRANEEST